MVRLRDSKLPARHAALETSCAVQWAGTTVHGAGFGCAFNHAGDYPTGGLQAWASAGSFGRLVPDGCGVYRVILRDMEMFERGQPSPATRVSYGGTRARPQAEITKWPCYGGTRSGASESVHPARPSGRMRRLSPAMRDLETPDGVGARRLRGSVSAGRAGDSSSPTLQHTLAGCGMAPSAARVSGGVAVADLSSTSPQPYAVVPAGGGRRAVISGDPCGG
jgi:hypothetical protein